MDRSEIIKWTMFAGIGIFILLIFAKLFSYMKSFFVSSTIKIDAPKILPKVNGGNVPADFQPSSYSIELHEVLSSTFSITSRCNVLERAHEELNDNQLIMVYNDYNNQFGKSLKLDLQDVWLSGCVGTIWSESYNELLVKRLNGVGVV